MKFRPDIDPETMQPSNDGIPDVPAEAYDRNLPKANSEVQMMGMALGVLDKNLSTEVKGRLLLRKRLQFRESLIESLKRKMDHLKSTDRDTRVLLNRLRTSMELVENEGNATQDPSTKLKDRLRSVEHDLRFAQAECRSTLEEINNWLEHHPEPPKESKRVLLYKDEIEPPQ